MTRSRLPTGAGCAVPSSTTPADTTPSTTGLRTIARPASTIAWAVILLLAACARGRQPDAYGTIEAATEVVAGSQYGGQLLRFTPVEGDRITAGTIVAVLDTTPTALQFDQAAAQRAYSAGRSTEADRQLDVLQVQLDIAKRDFDRTQQLYNEHAATAASLDQAERDYRTLVEQVRAQQATRVSSTQDVRAQAAHVAQLQDQIDRSLVRNPVTGTVLATYTKAGEVITPAQALYRIANLDTMDLRAYVAEPQLAQIRIGEPAVVSVDVGNGRRRGFPGHVSWIASTAEFTPTPIETRDERANLVYAVKVRVLNPDGILKIGMPGDVTFGTDSTRAAP